MLRVLLDRLDAANAIKKQMLDEAHLDKKRVKEESIPKFHVSSYMGSEAGIKQTSAAAENSRSPLLVAVHIKIYSSPISTTVKEEPFIGAHRILVEAEVPMGQISSSNQQNGYAERSCLQLKSYVSDRAEEMYIYRSLPLSQDGRHSRYWQFVASASAYDPGSGRIFVESSDGYWRLIDSMEVFDALLALLDTVGIRECHLHVMNGCSVPNYAALKAH